jgi:hypothetical protein
MRPLQRLPKGRATRGSKAPEQLARGRTPTKFELYVARRGSCTIASEPGGFGVGECHG